jgi:ribosomal protein S18 acetylase RimI-like enzyme
MNDEVLIRNLVLEDAIAVWQLGLEAFTWPSERIIWDEAVVRWFVDHACEWSFVAIYDDRIIGFVLSRISDRLGYVGWITVDAGWRKQGIGRQLMDRALTAFRAAGTELVSSFVREDHQADSLFERCGFRDIGLRKLDLVLQLTPTPPVRE